MKSYKVRALIEVQPNGSTEILYEIEPEVFVEEKTFIKWAQEKAEVLGKEVEKAKTVEKKARVKAFLKKAVAKLQEKNKSFWNDLYLAYPELYDDYYKIDGLGKVSRLPKNSPYLPIGFSPSFVNGLHDAIPKNEIIFFLLGGCYILGRAYSIYKQKKNFPKPNKDVFKVGFLHIDVSDIVKDDPNFPNKTPRNIIGTGSYTDIYGNNKYSAFYELTMGYDIDEKNKIYHATKCEGGRIYLKIANPEKAAFYEHIALTLITDKEDLERNKGIPFTTHYRVEFGKADDEEMDTRVENAFRKAFMKATWLQEYLRQAGVYK